MTDQETIKWIDGRILELACIADITSKDKQMQRINKECSALMRARMAVEKRIPLAPMRTITHDDEMWKRAEYQCPACTEIIFTVEAVVHPVCGWERATHGTRSPFCHSCGQALTWSKLAKNSAIDGPPKTP